ncbi:unnamed protein product [Prunus armeniaca]|uniref:Uncharacterized protein n=1 Tax=Prunus armeniaca TaxID=36596 RepID=A0A6J5V6L8_PRUAR|nr:unnamed protein product [Prunus armeniaca]
MSSTCLVSHDSHCSCRLYVDFYVNNRKDPLVQRQNQNNLYLLRTNPFPYASTSSSSSPKDYWLLKLEEDFLPEALELSQNELENLPYMLGKLQMSILWSTSWIIHIIFLEAVMAVLTLKDSQEAEQFVTAMKAINPINLTAKTDAAKNKPAETYSNI